MTGPRWEEGARESSFRKEGEKCFAVTNKEPGGCFFYFSNLRYKWT